MIKAKPDERMTHGALGGTSIADVLVQSQLGAPLLLGAVVAPFVIGAAVAKSQKSVGWGTAAGIGSLVAFGLLFWR